MSSPGQVHTDLLEEFFGPHGIKVEETDIGLALVRESDQKAYPFVPTEDGFARGTQLFYACKRFGLDPYSVLP